MGQLYGNSLGLCGGVIQDQRSLSAAVLIKLPSLRTPASGGDLDRQSGGRDQRRGNAGCITPGSSDLGRQAYDHELRLVLERAIDASESYRVVFVLRLVEGLSAPETGACHRAASLLRKNLPQHAGMATA